MSYPIPQSQTLALYKEWMSKATHEQFQTVDQIYLECEKHYNEGGDVIVETFGPEEILLENFQDIDQLKAFCNLHSEQASNCRWGEDSDDELKQKEWQ